MANEQFNIHWGGGGTHIQQLLESIADVDYAIDLSGNFIIPLPYTAISFYNNASSTIDDYIANQAQSTKNLTFINSTQSSPNGQYATNVYRSIPFSCIDKLQAFYMEIVLTDNNTDKYTQGQTDDDWDDKYTIDFYVGEGDYNTEGINSHISSLSNAIEVWIGRMGVGNMYVGGNAVFYDTSIEDTVEISNDGVDDIRYADSPHNEYVIALGIREGQVYTIYHNGADQSTLKAFTSSSNNIDKIYIPNTDNSVILFTVYSETLSETDLKSYFDNISIKINITPEEFRFKDIARQYYPDIT